MQIKIESNGNVTVSGIEDKEVREQVQKLVEEKYSDRMYQYYTGIADSVGNLSSIPTSMPRMCRKSGVT